MENDDLPGSLCRWLARLMLAAITALLAGCTQLVVTSLSHNRRKALQGLCMGRTFIQNSSPVDFCFRMIAAFFNDDGEIVAHAIYGYALHKKRCRSEREA